MDSHVAIDTILPRTHGMATVRMAADLCRACVECRFPMTSQAGDTLPRHQQLVAYGAMYAMTGCTPVTHGIMFEDEGSSHLLVTAKALVVTPQQRCPA